MSLRKRLLLEWLAITAFASLLALLAVNWRGTESFDYLFYDQLASMGRVEPDADIVIVAIDDASLAQLGRFPWPRDIHAQLLDRLAPYKPRSVTLDLILSEASDQDADASLARSMAQAVPVLIPLHFPSPGSDGKPYDIVYPIPVLNKAAKGSGHVNVEQDSDGIVRRAMLCFNGGAGIGQWPHLTEQIYRTAHLQKASKAFRRAPCGSTLLIPYAPLASYTTISYADLLSSDVPADMLRGRDIMVGATALGLQDNFPVPFADGGVMPGVEIMANMLAAIKRDNYITQLSPTLVNILTISPILLLMFAFLKLNPRIALLLSLGMFAVLLLGSGFALGAGIWFPPGAALAGLFVAYPLWGWRRLQAVSDFMENELRELEEKGEAAPFLFNPESEPDIIGQQSAALASSIDNIRDLRRFLSDVISDMPDPMVVVDGKGRIVMSSDLADARSGQSVVGYPIQAVLKEAVVAEDWSKVRDYLKNLSVIVDQDDFVRFRSTVNRTFTLRRSPIKRENGDILGQVYYLADISALAEAEVQREEMLSLLSHDMRAPQSAIIAALSGKLDIAAKNRIEKNARKTMQLAQDFVDMARMGETEFDGEEVLLSSLVVEVADSFYALAQERSLRIVVRDSCEDAFITAEAQTLSRAFANLIDNAIKFSPKDSVIDINLSPIEKDNIPHIAVIIADKGKGIDPDILPRLFSRFATHDTEQRRATGTGLGLSFVQAVAIRHGGDVTASNGANGGAEFTVILPEAIEDID